MSRYYSNTAVETSLASGITSSDTTITVGAATGFPASTPYTLALDAGGAGEELVSVTAVAGTTLTVTRGYDNTTAVSHSAGAVVQHAHSAADFRDARNHEAATYGVHGINGDVVGTSDPQTLTYKDLTDASNVLPSDIVYKDKVQTVTKKTFDESNSFPTPLASTAKKGKRLHWGVYSGTSDGSSILTITHGAGFTPTAAWATHLAATGALYDVAHIEIVGSTQVRLRVLDGGGTLQPNATLTLALFLGE